MIPYSNWSFLANCIEPYEKFQIDFGGAILNEKRKEQYFLTGIDSYSKYHMVEIVNTASSKNAIEFQKTHICNNSDQLD